MAEDRRWRSSSSKFNTGGPVLKELLWAWRPRGWGRVGLDWTGRGGEEEEGSQSVGDLQGGRRGGVRAAAERCTLQQAGTQWPHYHTGWQGLQ